MTKTLGFETNDILKNAREIHGGKFVDGQLVSFSRVIHTDGSITYGDKFTTPLMTTESQAMREAAAKVARENESHPLGRTGGYAGGWREACAYIQECIEVLPLPQPDPDVEAMAVALEKAIDELEHSGLAHYHPSIVEPRTALANYRARIAEQGAGGNNEGGAK